MFEPRFGLLTRRGASFPPQLLNNTDGNGAVGASAAEVMRLRSNPRMARPLGLRQASGHHDVTSRHHALGGAVYCRSSTGSARVSRVGSLTNGRQERDRVD